MIRAGLHRILRRASARYIAGPELPDAVAVCRKLSGDGFASTLGFWDSGQDGPQTVVDEYIKDIDAARQQRDCYVSIKLTAFGSDTRLQEAVLSAGAQRRVRVHFDSQAPVMARQTFSLLEDWIRRTGNPRLVSCTLPGRWRRSVRDAESVVAMGLSVRVVKGQWEDDEGPEIDPRAAYLNVIDALAGRAAHVSVATHDPVLALEAIKRLRSANTPCGLEQLLGLPTRHMIKLASSLDIPVRFYVPYGYAWLPYALRQIKRNPRVLYWIARDVFAKQDSQYRTA